ncbi:WXG100 family type VII secretion target [Amycolatopsis sp.]|uniref:WXG100 family type VII secretion target n=1 Tax=Amycolatopsis sp. TaxID=37632 RepID=UPI002B58C824|nr:WXG100 family type VII secretion target [Amycolatopsis sp.]HVV14310.1 WXG100 family type VII secretion target [Amycolatopsis sp.]
MGDETITGQQSGISIKKRQDPGFVNTDTNTMLSALPGPLGSGYGTFNTVKGALADGQVSGGEIAGIAGSAAGFVSSCMSVSSIATDPVGWLVGQGLNFLMTVVQPLQDAIHFVSGDGPALAAAAGNFGAIGTGLQQYSQKFVQEAQASLANWDGDAADAAATKLAQFAEGIDGIAGQSGDIAQLLQISSMVMQVIEEFIKAILTELITWLIMIWIPALAAAVPTCGGSTAAAGTATGVRAAQTGSKVSRYVQKLKELLDTVKNFLVKLKDFFGKWKGNFKQIMDTKAMQSGLAKLESQSAKEAGKNADWGTRLNSAEGGMVGKRAYDGAGKSFGTTGKKAGLNTVGLGGLVNKKGEIEVPGTVKGKTQLGVDAAGKVAKHGSNVDKAAGYGETGGDQTPEETSDDLNF